MLQEQNEDIIREKNKFYFKKAPQMKQNMMIFGKEWWRNHFKLTKLFNPCSWSIPHFSRFYSTPFSK